MLDFLVESTPSGNDNQNLSMSQLFSDDPSNILESANNLSPVRRLWFFVLLDGMGAAVGLNIYEDPEPQEVIDEWLERHEDVPFGFRWICEEFGINPDSILKYKPKWREVLEKFTMERE